MAMKIVLSAAVLTLMLLNGCQSYAKIKVALLLSNGIQADNEARYHYALYRYMQALSLSQENNYRQGEAQSLNNLGLVYQNLGEYPQALEHHEAALKIFREIGDRRGEAASFNNLGNIYETFSQYLQAGKNYEASVRINREIGDRNIEATNLNNLGIVYRALNRYQQALKHYEDSLKIRREIGDRKGESDSLGNMGIMYDVLNQYPQALKHYEASLKIKREIGDRMGEARILQNQGIVYHNLGQYTQAIEYYEASLKIKREIGDLWGEASSLGNLGNIYKELSQYPQAREHYEASLKIFRKIGDRNGEATCLSNLGAVSQQLQFLEYTQQAIAIQKQIKDPEGLWKSWNNLADALENLDRIDAVILAGKQAVNNLQGIRSGNTALEKKLQNSFLKNKTHVYHGLASLLIEQDRLAEAEQIMAMLKEEEYFDYIQRDGRGEVLEIRAGYTSAEQIVVAELDQLGKQLAILGEKYENLVKLSKIDEQAKAGLSAVKAELERVEADFHQLLSTLQERLTQARSKVAATEFDSPRLKELQQKVLAKNEAAMISTVITTDKLYLLLTTPHKQLVRHSDISAEKLNKLISGLHNSLRHPRADLTELKELAQDLYAQLVKPLESDLEQIKAKNLMWALDGALRYVPMAALFDGKQFLIEKYGLSLYTPAAHSTWGEVDTASWRAVGLGVSQAFPGFGALPAVPHELRSIIRQDINDQSGALPGEIYLDRAFDRDRLESVVQKPENRVLHIASHFKLQSGDSSASKLLLGDGDTLSLNEFREQSVFELRNVDLLTLSACDTAIGERGTGGEIESFAVLAQRKGANGVLASLWRVEDKSTALLMKQFYRLRSKTKSMNMAEALRQAQIALLKGEIHSDEHDYSHPFFWSPFVMMGNWL